MDPEICKKYSLVRGQCHSLLLRWLFHAVAEQLKLRRRPYTVTPCEQPISSLSISNENPSFAFNCPFAPTDIIYNQTYVCLFLLQFIFYSTSLSTIVTLCVQPVSSLPYAISNALQLLKIYLMLDFRIFHRMSLVCEIPYAYMHLCCFSVQPGSGSPRGQPAKAQKPHQSCCQIFASALMCLYDLWIQNY